MSRLCPSLIGGWRCRGLLIGACLSHWQWCVSPGSWPPRRCWCFPEKEKEQIERKVRVRKRCSGKKKGRHQERMNWLMQTFLRKVQKVCSTKNLKEQESEWNGSLLDWVEGWSSSQQQWCEHKRKMEFCINSFTVAVGGLCCWDSDKLRTSSKFTRYQQQRKSAVIKRERLEQVPF